MKYIWENIHILLSVCVMFAALELSKIAVPSGPSSSAVPTGETSLKQPDAAARYSGSNRSWTISAKVIGIRNVSIYGRPGSIAQIEYMNNGERKRAWAAVRIDDYSFSDNTAIAAGDRITLKVSGMYVSSKGVDWTACPGADLYCENASFIEGGFPVSEDFGGLTISPSNTLIHQGNVPTGDWVNGILAWKIRHITSRRSDDVQRRDR